MGKNFIQRIVVPACGVILTMASCSDYLNLYPEDEIVDDAYWTNATDVENVVASAYRFMLETDVLQRCVYLGEMRSDNLEAQSPNSNESAIINNGVILSDNPLSSWASFYKVINICNTVLKKAPDVCNRDLNYTPSDLNHNLAEALFIRSLCYFYLVRGWGDVPYVTTPSNSDATDYNVAQTSAGVVIGHLIEDVTWAKEYAVTNWGTQKDNCGRVTANACRALLADIYLWNEQYDKCIAECDEVLENYTRISTSTQNTWMLTPFNQLFSSVFYTGNSIESIFELNLNSSNPSNLSVFSSLYGNASTTPHFKGTASLMGMYDQYDVRGWQYLNATNSRVFKFVGQDAPMAESKASLGNTPSYTYRSASSCPNWIIYRLADIYLMKAEALAVSGSDADDFELCATLVNKTYYRAQTEAGDSLDHALFANSASALTQVMDERRREFAFEGKRWFDLLRQVLRNGGPTTDAIETLVTNKYAGMAPDGISAKLSSIGYWYWPIHKTEMDINPNLHQNAYYIQLESSK